MCGPQISAWSSERGDDPGEAPTDVCASLGMTLARPESEAQSKALGAATKAARKKKSKWWIGVTDRAAEDEFRWTDGAPASVGFTRWAKGEPDNDSCNQDCGALSDKGNGAWNDTHCASRLPFVCERFTKASASLAPSR